MSALLRGPAALSPVGRHIGAAALITTLTLLTTSCASGNAEAGGATAPGVTNSKIVLATSMDLTGPAGAPGVANSRGTDAWFKKVNADGGVHGRTIEYKVVDDGFDVARALANTRNLVDEPVFAFVGSNGAGSIVPTAQLLNQRKVPYLFPSTGKPEYATEVLPYVFAMLPTFSDQLGALISWSAKEKGPGAVFHLVAETTDVHQQTQATEAATKRAGGKWLGSAVVPIGVPDVTPFALQAAEGSPDYIALSTGPVDAIKIINYLASVDRLPKKGFLDVTPHPGQPFLSGVTSPQARALVYALAPTVPPTDPLAKDCNAALARFYPDQKPDAQSLFGCAVAQATVAALDAAGADLTRKSLVDALESMHQKKVSDVIPPLTFGRDRHMGATGLPLVVIKESEFSVVTTVHLDRS
jgi:branched-chain amino acid transport system substrate-binding protein